MWEREGIASQTLWARDEAYWSMLMRQERLEAELPLVYCGTGGVCLAVEGYRRLVCRPGSRKVVDAEEEACWKQLEECLHSMQVLTVKATGYNRGGLLVKVNGLQGFVPSSQIKELPRELTDEERAAQMAAYVGQELRCRIIELDRERNRIILSERAATPDGLQGEKLLEELREGTICTGVVSNIRPFGVFVDLGGMDGLVHVSELSWRRVEDPRELVCIGMKVQALVLAVDKERRRVALSLKRMQPDPWEGIEQRYQVGQVVVAQVRHVVEFGVFASIDEHIEGLVHISEIDLPAGEPLFCRIRPGDEIRVRILHIDRDNRRLALSMRGVSG